MKDKILKLELKKKELSLQHVKNKLQKYNKANSIISNVISQDEIDDLIIQIQTLEIEIQIIKTQLSE